ncbi:MAG: DUF975 family protein [Mobilitalea sp.]
MLYAADFRSTAREGLNGNWSVAVGTGFVAALLGVGASGGSGVNIYNNYNRGDYNNLLHSEVGIFLLPFFIGMFTIAFAFLLVAFFCGGAATLGYCRFNLNLIDHNEPRFNNLFSKFDIFWKAFGMQFLIGLYTLLWSLLFIIPGIIAGFSYAMTPYILEENPNMGINEAIGISKEMMRGNKWRLFCLQISFIGWSFLCLFTLGIGYLWLAPYCSAADAAFFKEVSGKNNPQQTYSEPIYYAQ